MADILAQTIRVVSARGMSTITHFPVVATFPSSAPEMQDGNNSTGSRMICTDQGLPASGGYREDWILDTATVPGPYSFVRVAVRGKRIDGHGPTTQSFASYQPSIAGVRRGQEVELVQGGADNVQDLATDPADSQPWTAVKVNAQRWGWWLTAFLVSSDFDEFIQAWLTEYRLELWVPTPPAEPHELGPYTMEVLEDTAGYWG